MYFKVCLPHVSLIKSLAFFFFFFNLSSISLWQHLSRNPHPPYVIKCPWKPQGPLALRFRVTDGSSSNNVRSEETVSCAHIYGSVRNCILNFVTVCVRVFSYKYMRGRNIYVNINPNVDINDVLDRFTASTICFHTPLLLPLHSSNLCVVPTKSSQVCSLMDVHMNYCSIVIFAFFCYLLSFFFCTINHLFSL